MGMQKPKQTFKQVKVNSKAHKQGGKALALARDYSIAYSRVTHSDIYSLGVAALTDAIRKEMSGA